MQGVFPAGELDALQDVEQALAPGDPVQRYEWLFARQLPELGDNRRFSDPGYETALRERRNAAVAEVERRGLDALHGLASDAVDARIVSGCLATAAGDKYRTNLVAMIPAATPADEGLAEGWLARRFQDEGWTWLDGLLAEEPTPEQAAVALLASRDYPKAWQVADSPLSDELSIGRDNHDRYTGLSASAPLPPRWFRDQAVVQPRDGGRGRRCIHAGGAVRLCGQAAR